MKKSDNKGIEDVISFFALLPPDEQEEIRTMLAKRAMNLKKTVCVQGTEGKVKHGDLVQKKAKTPEKV